MYSAKALGVVALRNPWLLLSTAMGGLSILLGLTPLYIAPLNILLGILLVLLVPGYTVMAASFKDMAIGAIEKLALSVGLSICIATVAGLVLNITPWGLQRTSWSICLGAITLVASLASIVRRASFVGATGGLSFASSLNIRVWQALLLCLAGLIAVMAAGISALGVQQQPVTKFTQLWISQMESAQGITVRLSVSNQEETPKDYRLEVVSGGNTLQLWPSIRLAVDQKWEGSVVVPDEYSSGVVEALLYVSTTPEIAYRTVNITLGAAKPSSTVIPAVSTSSSVPSVFMTAPPVVTVSPTSTPLDLSRGESTYTPVQSTVLLTIEPVPSEAHVGGPAKASWAGHNQHQNLQVQEYTVASRANYY